MFCDQRPDTTASSHRKSPECILAREQARTGLREPSRSALTSLLRHTPLLRDLPDDIIHAVACMSVPKTLKKGEYLFYEGAMAQGFYIVQRGAIKLHRISVEGKERVFQICRPAESFAEEVVYSDTGFALNASATEDSQVLLVRKVEFLTLVKREPQLALSVLRSMNRQFENLMALLNDLTLKDVTTRLLGWLLERCPDPNSCKPYAFRLHQPKRQLAAELGTVSETFSRTLAKFRAQNLISIDRDTVTLLSPNRIARLLAGSKFLVPSGHTSRSRLNLIAA